jgi:uncharacterized coiled-coil protein SlyX
MEETLSIQQLEGHLKKHILKTVITSVISACFLAIGIGVAFFYETEFRLQENEKTDSLQTAQINALTDAVGKIGTPVAINSVQISNLESKVKEVKTDLTEFKKEVNTKLDRILENQQRK